MLWFVYKLLLLLLNVCLRLLIYQDCGVSESYLANGDTLTIFDSMLDRLIITSKTTNCIITIICHHELVLQEFILILLVQMRHIYFRLHLDILAWVAAHSTIARLICSLVPIPIDTLHVLGLNVLFHLTSNLVRD